MVRKLPWPFNPQERYIEKAVTDHAVKVCGWLSRKLQWIGRHGAPDRFYLRLGRHVFVEFKQRGKKPTEHQATEIERLRDKGAEVYVIDNIEDGIALFNRLTHGDNYFESDDTDII